LKTKSPNLSIFETFKTKTHQLTGEAKRQRNIITHLAQVNNSVSMTRTAIAQNIAEKNGLLWKNIYSGVFRDMDEILIPLGIVIEAGRLPLKRGPKALQEKGIPFYKLTKSGILVALSIDELENKKSVLDNFLSKAEIKEKEFVDAIKILVKVSPKLTYSIFEIYVNAYCNGKLKNLLPFSISEFYQISRNTFAIQKELLEGFQKLSKSNKLEFLNMFSKFT
tara:strand:- start:123 stop:788 length:666 start_codon:yes stop_codon:yes gene_type:complete